MRGGGKRGRVVRSEGLREGISRLGFSPCMELGMRMGWQASQEKGQSEAWISSALGWKLGRAAGPSTCGLQQQQQNRSPRK